ncbi:hypothetical protein Tco_0380582 [Tanacetum coccineum]
MPFRINQINLIRTHSVSFFHLELQGNAVLVKSFGYLESWAFQIRLAEFLLPNPFAKLSRSFIGMDQSGSEVIGLSSSGIGFNHYGLYLIFGRWA